MAQKEVKQRIDSVKNVQKITRAMEMVAAARLRRAEQRIERLRPYAGAIRRMTRQAAEAAGAEMSPLPILQEHESQDKVAILLVPADREVVGGYTGFTDRPGYENAREIAEALMAAYVDGEIDRVDIFYNGYVSALTQEVRRETLLPMQQATVLEGGEHDVDKDEEKPDD